MAYKSIMDGVVFVEGPMDSIKQLGNVTHTQKGFFSQDMKTLSDIKKELVQKAHTMGANAIINFKYGQKSTSYLRAVALAWNANANWYAEGTAVVLDDAVYNKIVKQLTSDADDE